jgi:hypothetical protein
LQVQEIPNNNAYTVPRNRSDVQVAYLPSSLALDKKLIRQDLVFLLLGFGFFNFPFLFIS